MFAQSARTGHFTPHPGNPQPKLSKDVIVPEHRTLPVWPLPKSSNLKPTGDGPADKAVTLSLPNHGKLEAVPETGSDAGEHAILGNEGIQALSYAPSRSMDAHNAFQYVPWSTLSHPSRLHSVQSTNPPSYRTRLNSVQSTSLPPYTSSLHYGAQSIGNIPYPLPFEMRNVVAPGVALTTSALQSHLLEKAIVDAGFDSAARFPPPRCHPGTRRTLRERITTWLVSTGRSTSLLWLHGPAGVGKSAAAQTIAEECNDRGCLAVAFFFSQSHIDPYRAIASLAYQLAVGYPGYQELASYVPLADPAILEKALRIQFQKLVTEPLFQSKDMGRPVRPLLFLLDGLDECQTSGGIRRELIELIAEFAVTANASGLPFVWVITSRPDREFFSTFSKYQCWQEELRVDTAESREDVSLFLHDGFAKIRAKYTNMFSEGTVWPRVDQLSAVEFSASGFFGFASTVLKFVDSDEDTNPVARLKACVDFLVNPTPLQNFDPFQSLHTMYWDILQRIPIGIRPVTLRILAYLVLVDENNMPAQLVANILFLDQATFYASLQGLHSVLDIPNPDVADKLPVNFYHVSFQYFIRYLVTPPKVNRSMSGLGFPADFQSFYVRWCNLWGMKFVRKLSNEEFDAYIPWPGDLAFDSIFQFVSTTVWRMWRIWPTAQLYGHLYCFDFASHHDTGLFSQKLWPDLHHPTPDITSLLLKLASWVAGRSSTNSGYYILRTEAKCPTDRRLFEEYNHLINHQGVKKLDLPYVKSDPGGWSYICLSLKGQSMGLWSFPRTRDALLNPHSMYFLLGHDTSTCLVIMHRPALEVSRYIAEAFQQLRGAHPEVVDNRETWPAPEDLEQINSASKTPQAVFVQARLPSLARAIVAFVGHPDYANPAARLKTVLNILSHHHDQMATLELLRAQSLIDIPQDIRPTTDRVLAFLICHATRTSRRGIPAERISFFLDLEQEIVEKVLRMVNLILCSRPLPFPISAVADFDLSDLHHCCTTEYGYIPKHDRDKRGSSPHHETTISPQTWSEISIQYARWSNRLLVAGIVPEDNDSNKPKKNSLASSPAMASEEAYALFKRDVLAGGHWIAFSQVVQDTAAEFAAELRDSCFFPTMASYCDFHIPYHDKMATHFGSFINKLQSYQAELNLEPVIRVDRNCDMDDELLAKWTAQGGSRQKAIFPIDFTWVTCYFTTSQSNWAPETFASGIWTYFWLGHDKNTCLVTLQLEDEPEAPRDEPKI